MQADVESQTAIAAAILRAAHQVLDREPWIVDDPVSLNLVPGSSVAEIRASAERLELRFMRVLRASFLVRSRIAEDALCRAVSEGVHQYVLLGAGLDTFAYRQPPWASSLEIFELDHPASQQAKTAHLEKRGLAQPKNLRFCPIDFETQGLRAGLARAGFRPETPSFFSWLGVIPYLSETAIESTLREIAELRAQTTIALSYVVPDSLLPDADAEAVSISSSAAAQRGEPWLSRFEPLALEAKLRSLGYDSIEHFGPAEYEALFFQGRTDGLPVPCFERVIVASREPGHPRVV